MKSHSGNGVAFLFYFTQNCAEGISELRRKLNPNEVELRMQFTVLAPGEIQIENASALLI
jgi:hypothetical protein